MTSKEQYDTPKLIELGSVESLTQGPSSGRIDSIFGADGGFEGCTLSGCPTGETS
jgi:hypothetical protein